VDLLRHGLLDGSDDLMHQLAPVRNLIRSRSRAPKGRGHLLDVLQHAAPVSGAHERDPAKLATINSYLYDEVGYRAGCG